MTNDDDLACRDLVAVVSDYLEGDLSGDARSRFEAHLGICDACQEYVDQVRATVAAARATGTERTVAAVPPGVLEAFRAWRRG